MFENIPLGAPDPAFGLVNAFQKDPKNQKVDLIVGVYKNENLLSEMLPSVVQAKQETMAQDVLADYLPIEGFSPFLEGVGKLLFGPFLWEKTNIAAVQSVGGTSALCIGGEFLSKFMSTTVALPSPTWANHFQVFERAHLSPFWIPYYDVEKLKIDREAFFEKVAELPPRTVLLLHASCHNPSGADLSLTDWKALASLCKAKELIPFFDCAYQGFGKGIEEDARAIRLFVEQGIELFVAYSCSKNFSLYSQRVGALFAVTSTLSRKEALLSQLKKIVRSLYSTPAAHGARIVAHVLGSKRREWEIDLEKIRTRIKKMKFRLIELLGETRLETDFSSLKDRNGMFVFLPLSNSQVKRLIEEKGIYLLSTGRINVAGLNDQNIERVVDAIEEVCLQCD